MAANILFLTIYLNLIMTNNEIFSELILKWYKKNKRNLPWRKTKEPYKIWVSEIILQQTQMSQGIKYYLNFIENFPNLESLAKSNDSNVLKVWEGLGYYSRAINMLNTAKFLIKNNKDFPSSYDELIKLKGIGDYTASAISSICKNERRAVLDGNVFRVISRVFNISKPINQSSGKKIFQKITLELLPRKKTGNYNQALMDFGSTHCTIKKPKCIKCSIQQICKSFKLKNIEFRPVKIKNNETKKNRLLNYFIIIFRKKIFINKRIQKDIWRNLYEPPLLESNKIISKHLIQQTFSSYFKKTNTKEIELSKKISHKLSHQNLEIYFWKVNVSSLEEKKENKLIKVDFKSLSKYPFPKPIAKYLNEYLIT